MIVTAPAGHHAHCKCCKKNKTKDFFRTVRAKILQPVECVLTNKQRNIKKGLPQHQQVMLIANAVRRTRTKIFFRTVTAKRLQPVEYVLTNKQRNIKKGLPQHHQVMLIANAVRKTRTKIFLGQWRQKDINLLNVSWQTNKQWDVKKILPESTQTRLYAYGYWWDGMSWC